MAPQKQATKWKQSESDEEGGSSTPSDVLPNDVGHANEAEAPKFAQYVDSDEASEDDTGESEEESNESESSADAADVQDEDMREESIRRQMESIPYSKLVRAKKAIGNNLSDAEESNSEEDEFAVERAKQHEGQAKKKKNGWQDLEKRDNKHAPMEMSTRKPVSRRRTVVDVASSTSRRDPRFSSLSASLPNSGLFRTSYGFLRDQQSNEVAELKSAYNKLRRQEENHAGPKARSALAQTIRQEREEVEMALRRAQGRENERKKREREGGVIKQEKKAIQQRVKEGGKQFYLKDSAKKQLILQDKYDRLSGEKEDQDKDSRKDLKRAIERRRRKNASKERREMPLGSGTLGRMDSDDVPKRKRAAQTDPITNSSKHKRKISKR